MTTKWLSRQGSPLQGGLHAANQQQKKITFGLGFEKPDQAQERKESEEQTQNGEREDEKESKSLKWVQQRVNKRKDIKFKKTDRQTNKQQQET